jgi:hypothetical protein
MPLAKGKSNKAVSKNIQTLVDDYQKSGRIGTSKPANKKAAVKQATAIALQTAGRSKPKKFAAGGSTSAQRAIIMEENPSASVNKTTSSSSAKESEAPAKQQQQIPFLQLANQRAPEEDTFPKFKQTRPRLRFTPSQYDVARGATAEKEPANLKKGGKVSVKKRRA